MTPMLEGVFVTELWMDKRLPLKKFRSAFQLRFPAGIIHDVIEDVVDNPHYRLLDVRVPLGEKESVLPFFDLFCQNEGAALSLEPRSTFPRAGIPE